MATTLLVIILIVLIGVRLFFAYSQVLRRVDAYQPPSQGIVLEYSRQGKTGETMKLIIPPGTPKEEMQAAIEAFRAGNGAIDLLPSQRELDERSSANPSTDS